MSLTSIQKNINSLSLPTNWTCIWGHIQVGYSSLGFAYCMCSCMKH
jgi:type 1 glutamine amidotransferase